MPNLVFDLEADNFLPTLTKIHCLVTMDVDTQEIQAYYENQEDIYDGLCSLYNADKIIGHNIISFDIPAIQKLYPKWKYKALDDTFILSCLFDPFRPSHSIESYSQGTKVQNEDWSCLTYNMLDRCVIDTIVSYNIYKKFEPKLESWDKAIQLEYQVAKNHVRQVKAGVDIDLELVYNTLDCLDQEMDALEECIQSKLPYRTVVDKHQFKKVFRKDGKLQGCVDKYFNGEARSIHES